jgi:hypothetical protein
MLAPEWAMVDVGAEESLEVPLDDRVQETQDNPTLLPAKVLK